MIIIHSEHLQLLPVRRLHKEAFQRGRAALAQTLGVALPDGWPQFPRAFALRADEPPDPIPLTPHWLSYLFLAPGEGLLVGNGGYKGRPDAEGVVEIGYEIAPPHQGRGLATEAASALVGFAFGHSEVQAVRAHTLAETNASNRVLQKLGMKRTAEVEDSGVGLLWRWELSREEHDALGLQDTRS